MIAGLIVLACILTALFAGLEAALSAVPAARLRHEAEKQGGRALAFQALWNRRASLLSCAVLLSVFTQTLAIALLARRLLPGPATPASAWISFGILSACLLALLILPKAIFLRLPLAAILRLSAPLFTLRHLLRPLERLFARLPVLRAASLDQARERSAFLELAGLAAEEGILSPEETAIVRHTLEFDQVKVRHLMLPLRRVTAVPEGISPERVCELARATNLSQFPVQDGKGNIVGLVRLFELLKAGPAHSSVRPLMRDLVRIPSSTPALVALQMLRLARTEIGLVVSTRQHPLGIVNSYDIVETLMTGEREEKGSK